MDFDEMKFWMYLPISLAGSDHYTLPANVREFSTLIEVCRAYDHAMFKERYAYLTAKTLWVERGYIGNRPGWHTDGFGTDDINFIWSSRAPTEFFNVEPVVEISDDCTKSMDEMEKMFSLADWRQPHCPLTTYPDKHLLRLDPTVMHRSPVHVQPGMRTFFKLSLSHDRYNLKGNAVNHLLPGSDWPLVDRDEKRNHPTKES